MEKLNQKGISLIVLVISLAVVILLASIIILNLDTSDIIRRTSKTVIKTELSDLQSAVEEKTMSKSMKRDLIKILKLSDLSIQSDNYEEITAVKNGTLLVLNSAEDKIKEVAKDKGILARGGDIQCINGGLSLENVKLGEGVISYRIYGNSVQGATPTTSAPVQIQSVGNREINYTKYMNLYIENDKHIIWDTSGTKKFVLSEYIEVEPNTTYVVSMYNTYSDGPTTVSGAAYDKNKNSIDLIYTIERTAVGTYTATFTTPANTKYILLTSWQTDINVKLYEADGKTEYLPSKYKIPVVVTGKNIGLATDIYTYRKIDANNNRTDYSELVEDGRNCIKFVDALSLMYNKIHFKENTQYTIQFDMKTTIKTTGNTTGSHGIRVFYSDGTYNDIYAARDTDWTHKTLTTTAGKTVVGVGLTSYNYTNWIYIDIDTFQIEEGTSATEYTPYVKPITFDIYLDAPLRKVGDAIDYIDGINNRVVRNIGVIEKYNGEKIETEYISTTGSLTTGATVFYVLDKPVYEEVELPKISAIDKKTMITVGTKVLPSNIQVDY